MKVAAGVDLAGMVEPALDLCIKLGFPDLEVVLVHAVEPIPEYAPPMEPAVFDSRAWMSHLRAAGQEALDRVEKRLSEAGTPCRSLVLEGSPAAVLESTAEAEGAELIVLGAGQRSAMGSFLLGSAARSLASGSRRSLLIAKSEANIPSPVKAIFATDHSDYAGKCLNKLLGMHTGGLARLDVGTALEMKKEWWNALEETWTGSDGSVEEWFEGHVRRQTEEAAQKIARSGIPSRALIRRGHPKNVLRELVSESGADLLVMGAQGHGFFERVFVGSVSMHQIAAEAYPVLLIRA